MPALAIAEAYDARFPDTQVRLYAAAGGPATRLAAAAGRPLTRVAASPIARTGPLGRAAALLRVLLAIPGARAHLRAERTRLVIGTGGYASAPVLLAARSLGLPTAIVEPNACAGLANRWLRRWVDRSYVGTSEAARQLAPAQPLVTGTPVMADLVRQLQDDRVGPQPDQPCHLLILSASRGEQFLGGKMPAFVAGIVAAGVPLRVWHQAGDFDREALARAYAGHDIEARVTPVIDDMAAAYRWAHFAIARAGAGTIAELALAGLPALLVPLADAAADHQSANAAPYAAAGAALQTRESEWHEFRLAAAVAGVLRFPERWRAMSAAARATARPGAAAAVVADCERLMDGRW